jgi:hypothetical protein
MKKVPKSLGTKMQENANRNTALERGMIWVRPSQTILDKKKRQNKRACRVKISPITI